jgi:phosphoglycolate phosphatase-like HAD superfamily hydrolase
MELSSARVRLVNDGIATARDSLAATSAVLLDFDGPLCDVFAGMPAPTVDRRLAEFAGVVVDTDDPLQVLRHAAEKLDTEKLRQVEDALIQAEVEAIPVSQPTPGGRELVRQLIRSGHRVGVVSNNSTQAVAAFLGRHGLLADAVRL